MVAAAAPTNFAAGVLGAIGLEATATFSTSMSGNAHTPRSIVPTGAGGSSHQLLAHEEGCEKGYEECSTCRSLVKIGGMAEHRREAAETHVRILETALADARAQVAERDVMIIAERDAKFNLVCAIKGELATMKDHLATQRREGVNSPELLHSVISSINSRFAKMAEKRVTELSAVRTEIRKDTAAEVAAVRTEVQKELKVKLTEVQTVLKAKLTEVQMELKKSVKKSGHDIQTDIKWLATDLSDTKAELKEEMQPQESTQEDVILALKAAEGAAEARANKIIRLSMLSLAAAVCLTIVIARR